MGLEDEERDGVSVVYKMKVVQFLDRSVPIILQHDNGPCPLLAISNVLLLRNNVTLNLDMSEISQRELMSLVAEWLLDANSNVQVFTWSHCPAQFQNKDEEYVKNQQQNIEDAIQLLPRLATGIDVNVRFRHIHDFEFTPECAIFDLFHVGLVHGWLCDPQDEDTFKIIGANSYNTLVERLVALQALRAEQDLAKAAIEEEPTVDFAAATTATLGVPTPKLLKNMSNEGFEALNQCGEDGRQRRKGDDEEAAELMQALQLSQTGIGGDVGSAAIEDKVGATFTSHENQMSLIDSVPEVVVSLSDANQLSMEDLISKLAITTMEHVSHERHDPTVVVEGTVMEDVDKTSACVLKELAENQGTRLQDGLKPEDEEKGSVEREDLADRIGESGMLASSQAASSSMGSLDSTANISNNEPCVSIFTVGEDVKTAVDPLDLDLLDYKVHGLPNSGSVGSSIEIIPPHEQRLSSEHSSGHLSEEAEGCASPSASSGLGDDEPLYEGELSLPGSGVTSIGDKEPLYEGESVLAEQAEDLGHRMSGSAQSGCPRMGEENLSVALTEGLIIENFLSVTASQLTYHGLFSLQEGLKNNELYVFFRNNHFSTLFKYEGQIYLLATDQGYLNQPDLVWEKLSEVDGDSVFATGSFQLFQVDQSSGVWNEQDAVAATADFMSSQHGTAGAAEGAIYNSDLQLAMALQQQELAQQHQQQQQVRSPSSATPRPSQSSSKAASIGATPLVTGPSRSAVPPPAKQEKAKEKCTIM